MTLVHLALLHGVREPAQMRDRVEAFATAMQGQVASPASLFAGDAVEKGQSAPDRRSDLSGDPLFLVVTRLTGSDERGAEHGLRTAEATLAAVARSQDTWLLRERFMQASPGATGDEGDAWLQVVAMNVEAPLEDEFNEWYETEHAARIASVAPEFLSVQRFEALRGSPRHFALWRLTDRKAPERDPWLSASETPWTRRVRRFMRDRRRFMFAPFAG
jgi:hypothetical protein